MAWAKRVTVRCLERDVERALLLRAGHDRGWHRCKFDPERARDPIPPDEQQLCAHDVDVDATEEIVFRLPRDVAALFCALRRRISFEAMLDHALATWLARDPGARRPDPVIERDGYRCAVPGCTSRRNLHDHHIEFRSAGGSDAREPHHAVRLPPPARRSRRTTAHPRPSARRARLRAAAGALPLGRRPATRMSDCGVAPHFCVYSRNGVWQSPQGRP
ncbi:MAG TPA: hypothetical protein VMS55_15705 [Myxococcota bacterium]|nr:hypothetical protein [Myxococcota bacterium]